MAPDTLGRDAELTVIEDVLEAGTNGAAYLCIRGEPGIGKTTLLDAARRSADVRGYSTLTSSRSWIDWTSCPVRSTWRWRRPCCAGP